MLVVGINYWPEPTGIAPYTTGMAEYLAEMGANVAVITGVPHYPKWRVDPPYRFRLASRELRHSVHIVRLRHFVPQEMTAVRRAAYEATFLAHAALRGLRQKPDLVLTATPALGGALAAATVSRRVGCPLVVVVQDLTARATAESGITGGRRFTTVASRLEGAVLRRAARVALVTERFDPAVRALGVLPSRIALLRNWTHISPTHLQRDEARLILGWPTNRFLAIHTGNMGFKQDLGNVVSAAQLLDRTAIDLFLVGDGSQRRSLELQALGLANVRFLGPVDPLQYPIVLAAADLLLVNERPSVDQMSLPSKLTSYLAAGRPILAAVTAGGASAAELLSTGGAASIVAPGDPAALAAEIGRLAADRRRRASMSAAAAAYARSNLRPETAREQLLYLLRSSLEPDLPTKAEATGKVRR